MNNMIPRSFVIYHKLTKYATQIFLQTHFLKQMLLCIILFTVKVVVLCDPKKMSIRQIYHESGFMYIRYDDKIEKQ